MVLKGVALVPAFASLPIAALTYKTFELPAQQSVPAVTPKDAVVFVFAHPPMNCFGAMLL